MGIAVAVGAAPEAGLVLKVRPQNAILFNVRYNKALTGEDRIGDDFHLTYWGFNAGIVWGAD